MQIIFVFGLFTLMSAVVALPSGHIFMRQSCNIAGCVIALAPSVVSCVSAAAQEGVNLISDASCLAGAVKSAVDIPAACETCLDEFNIPDKIEAAATAAENEVGDVVGDAVNKVEDTASNIAGKVEDALSSIF
ncbi:hypothetical protein DXG01_016029 [Tephrocybe rancida]|nr:hypothetical protein DXG01_016029 [Tephrocybe rancida]